MNTDEPKSAVQKLRERHERIKKSIKPSKELIEIFSKKEPPKTENEKKKVANPSMSEVGA